MRSNLVVKYQNIVDSLQGYLISSFYRITITSYKRRFLIVGLILFYITTLRIIMSSYGCTISLVDKHLSIHIGSLEYFLFIVASQITNVFYIILHHDTISFWWFWVKKIYLLIWHYIIILLSYLMLRHSTIEYYDSVSDEVYI